MAGEGIKAASRSKDWLLLTGSKERDTPVLQPQALNSTNNQMRLEVYSSLEPPEWNIGLLVS